jgi:hypothetical protein
MNCLILNFITWRIELFVHIKPTNMVFSCPILWRLELILIGNVFLNQGCVSGSGFSDFVDLDLYWESGSGSRGKKIKKF